MCSGRVVIKEQARSFPVFPQTNTVKTVRDECLRMGELNEARKAAWTAQHVCACCMWCMHAVCTCLHTVFCAHMLTEAGTGWWENYDRESLGGDFIRGLRVAYRRE